ncbi:hypothetical protein LPB260_28165 [Pseudomonas sp. LPB0260]|uniref:hypothetical protein n=1 Tax=Pseudomonas sp. LPB0260 TaxID=2614442 RepID=UPI0015C23068|nr:hypothetical protein [Pseudomonas sp. LPB0260]QLC74557.1 hypothetical protein LPB260_13215 [Pseudomonas sp. LPB0260]QLC77326.1 hypothetical protein LPB260_28165 [Pseudomonas sp. LPB0260]
MIGLGKAYCIKPRAKPYLLVALLLLAGCDSGQAPATKAAAVPPSDPAAMTPLQRAEAGQALWKEKCRTVAGEKIYRTVADVEGLVLLKVRPKASDLEWADPNWPGAAFAKEARRDEYITTFLGYEYATRTKGVPNEITKTMRGYIETDRRPGLMDRPGYRYVDVIDSEDKQRYRYVLVHKPRPTSKIGWIDTLLEKSPAPDPTPRYGVTFEDHVIPEERALGVASSTVRVIDLETDEVLGEMLRYAWSTPVSSANPSPWLTAYRCPDHEVGVAEATRKFVDQVLIPRKEQ